MRALIDRASASPPTLEELASTVHQLSLVVRRGQQWNDRLGSAVRRLWHQTLVILLLLGVVGLLVYDRHDRQRADRPEILPYLYIVDMQGEVLWKGVPGQYEIKDTVILNHLEDWIKAAREREDDPTLMVLWKAWTRADQMVPKGSECYDRFQQYMRETDPRQLPQRNRVEVRVLAKKPMARQETSGEYRLSWQDIEIGRSGQMIRQTQWEGDFTVTLEVPRTILEAEKTTRYGIWLSKCTWSEKVSAGGL